MVRLSAFAVALGAATMGISFAYAQSGAPELAPAAGVETAAAAPAAAAATGDTVKGKELFDTWACGSCHSLKDAGASSPVGPALDGNPNLTHDLIVSRVTNGSGQMPAFGGQMTEQEIQDVAAYVQKASIK